MLNLPTYEEFLSLLDLFVRIKEINFNIDEFIDQYFDYIANGLLNKQNLQVEIEWLWYCHKLHPVKYVNDVFARKCSLDKNELIESSKKQANVAIQFLNKNYKFAEIRKVYNNTISNYFQFFSNLNPSNFNNPSTLEVDLLWHTHMNNPHNYYETCLAMHGQIIDHRFLSKDVNVAKSKVKDECIDDCNWFECG
jgi:hypothetical protein